MMNEQHEACAAAGADPVLIRLGKKKRKDIRKLARGKGRLFARVMEVQARVQAQRGAEGGDAPVLVVVKQKKRRKDRRWSGMRWW